VTTFIKTHPMRTRLDVDRVNCGAWKPLCVRRYNRIRLRFVQLNEHFIFNVLSCWEVILIVYL
jgi:hypothetical protein